MTAIVQSVVGTYVGATPCTASFASLPTAGNDVFALVLMDNNFSSGSVTSLTDNQGNTFSNVTAINDPNHVGVEVWRLKNIGATSGTYTVTAAYSGTQNANVVLLEASGLDDTSSYDITPVTAIGSGATLTLTAGSANATATDLEIALCVFAYDPHSATSVPTGFTAVQNDYGNTAQRAYTVAYRIATAIETAAATFTVASANQYAAILATFKAGSAPVVVQSTLMMMGVG